MTGTGRAPSASGRGGGAAADGDLYTEVLALLDLGLSASYAGDQTAAGHHGDALDALATVVGTPSIHGWAAYLHGERLAERDPTTAARHLTDAFATAEEVDDRFLAGVSRHTLMTTAARMDEAGHTVASSPACSTSGTARVRGPSCG